MCCEMQNILLVIFILCSCFGSLPIICLLIQYLIVGIHGVRNHYSQCSELFPRVAIIIPAWNEGNVIGKSIEMLMHMNYPDAALRVYIVDDASTDQTPNVIREKMNIYPQAVFHLRREKGGEGKAHTINHGLKIIGADDWAQAILITDADVLFEKDTLRRMTRHLADPKVGAITAYIKEGSTPGNNISKSIAFEYITAQAAARRAQNVMGVLTCLAGGAQLHSRANIKAVGGILDTRTLAEDTYTTFQTQLNDRKAIFDGNAIAWAEEPDSLQSLWKQRLRWARGNIQITFLFKKIWFNPRYGKSVGGIFFGLLWFVLACTPVFMLMSSIGLIGIFFTHRGASWILFKIFGNISFFAYLFVLFLSFLIDPNTAKRAWLQGILFPGVVSLLIMLASVIPYVPVWFQTSASSPLIDDFSNLDLFILFSYTWVSFCMFAAWGVFLIEKWGANRGVRDALLFLVGYGPTLCTITFFSLVHELRKTDLKWDKTEKKGNVSILK